MRTGAIQGTKLIAHSTNVSGEDIPQVRPQKKRGGRSILPPQSLGSVGPLYTQTGPLRSERATRQCPVSTDTVENVRFCQKQTSGRTQYERRPFSFQAVSGFGPPISLAILRRFWAAAARWNSSRAPQGPRNRNRSSFRIRYRCANSISTFLRSRLEISHASVLERSRARSRAPSWIERVTLRCGSFGQQRGFRAQVSQLSLLAR